MNILGIGIIFARGIGIDSFENALKGDGKVLLKQAPLI